MRKTCGRLAIALACAVLVTLAPLGRIVAHVYHDLARLPDPEPFVRFELPAIGHVYDAHGRPLIVLRARVQVDLPIRGYPPIFRHAILAAEDKRVPAIEPVAPLSGVALTRDFR